MHEIGRKLAPAVLVCAALAVAWIGYIALSSTPSTTSTHVPSEQPFIKLPEFHDYMEVVGGCGPGYEGTCVLAHTRPDHAAPVAASLRTGMVLKVAHTLEQEDGMWYEVEFDSWIRYPGRVSAKWYVAATSSLRLSKETGEENLVGEPVTPPTKRIVVDRSEQRLTAYNGDEVVLETAVSTGLTLTPTPRGTFTVYRKTPARYMQGPLPGISDQYYDLPGVPWNLYFTLQGGVVHGAYWHDKFGTPWSHGCVNLAPEDARFLYHWANIGTAVIIQD